MFTNRNKLLQQILEATQESDGAASLVDEGVIPVVKGGKFEDSPMRVENGLVTSSAPIQAPDGGSILVGDTQDIKTIGQQIAAQDVITGQDVVFPFRRVSDAGTDTAISSFSYEAAAWTPLQPSTAETLVLQQGEESTSYYTSTAASKVSGWRIQGLSGELRLELFGSVGGSERLIFDSDLHTDINGDPIVLDFKGGGTLEFLLNWSIGFRLGQVTKIVLTGKSVTPVQIYGLTIPAATTFGPDEALSNGGFIPWFESLRALESEDSFYPTDDTAETATNTWSASKVRQEIEQSSGTDQDLLRAGFASRGLYVKTCKVI